MGGKMKSEHISQEWETLEALYDSLENIETLPETLLKLAEQAKKLACMLDPSRTKEILEAEHMDGFLEPNFKGIVRASGDLFISRKRYGTECHVYFGKMIGGSPHLMGIEEKTVHGVNLKKSKKSYFYDMAIYKPRH